MTKPVELHAKPSRPKLLELKDAVAEVKRVMRLEGEAILQCVDRIETPEFRKAIESTLQYFLRSLENNGKIVIMGVGKSGKIGQKIAATLCSTGSLAIYLHPTEGLHGDLGVVSKNDVIIALSYTGNTDELVRLMPSLKSLHVPVIGIGGNSESKLAQLCEVWIDASVQAEACPHNLAPTTSTTLALAVGDALSIALMQLRGFDAATFAQNHPGGSLGRRLTLKVEDLMHSGEDVGLSVFTTPMDEVLITLSKKRLGAVLVVEGKKLLGIITEGDIRRALQHREKFFGLKASDVMTANPVTILSDQMAKMALDLMENRPFQISVLPVVDDAGDWKGLIRLHDLVKAL